MEPKYLGKPVCTPGDELDLIPWDGGPVTVTLHCHEFTSLCPVTGQPDFGTLTLTYVPGDSLVETKSLKLWLWRYRQEPLFNERVVAQLAATFMAQVRPQSVTVRGRFNVRGGIQVEAEVTL